jgi:hypothetical protein
MDNGDWGEEARLHPGIVRVGGLARALQPELDRASSPHRAVPDATAVRNWRTAVIEDGERCARVYADWREPRFVISLREGKVYAARAVAADLISTADVVHRWVSGARCSEIAAAWPILGSVELHRARERGDTLEYQWRRLYENPSRQAHWLLLNPFVALAFHEPRLRVLTPWTSMWTLCFSDSARKKLIPSVEPLRHEKELFVVRAEREEIGRAAAADSLALVLSTLSSITQRPS